LKAGQNTKNEDDINKRNKERNLSYVQPLVLTTESVYPYRLSFQVSSSLT